MGRGERLMDLLERLRGTEASNVDVLAQELGVSPRTIHRDLAALRDRGIPVTGESGPGGGVRLEGDRGVTAVHLTLAEVVTLWLSARLSQAASDLPWSGAADSALRKLLASLPKARASQLRALCKRVVVGEPASQQLRAAAGRPPTELLRLVEEAFNAGVALSFNYEDRNGQKSVRQVELHGLLVQAPVWYLLTHDLGKHQARSFRMDRISAPRLLKSIAVAPNPDRLKAALPDHMPWKPLVP
ncbi:MAG: WYL domain-containing protein [Polyangiales bacterium]